MSAVAAAGDRLEHPETGEVIVFLRTAADTGGELLELDDLWPVGHRVPRHVHPRMQERWEVLAGRATFRIDGTEVTAGPGDVVTAPAGAVHEAWSTSPERVRVRIELRPALRWEAFVEALFSSGGVADAGRLLHEFAAEIVVP